MAWDKKAGVFTREFVRGAWVTVDAAALPMSTDGTGMVCGFDPDDGEYWVLLVNDDPNELWDARWVEHDTVKASTPPDFLPHPVPEGVFVLLTSNVPIDLYGSIGAVLQHVPYDEDVLRRVLLEAVADPGANFTLTGLGEVSFRLVEKENK